MAKYLYGASVQGIQSFIFQTNKLAEIVGASELVEEICTSHFKKQLGLQLNKEDPNIILSAAGNIKYVFENRDECADFVKNFPKSVMEMTPGITISQAVVEYEDGQLNKALQNLEDKLREQRNKVAAPFESGVMGTERARRTGGVGFVKRKKRKNGEELIDEATHLKRKQSDPYYKYKIEQQTNNLFSKISGVSIENIDFKKDLALDVEKITTTSNNSWLAVIHADGNGLGKIIQNLDKVLKDKDDDKVKSAFKTFSKALETSTVNAAKSAFDEVVKQEKQEGKAYPIRPVILGGDDLTVIIRADLAFDFTKAFLRKFENESKVNLQFLKDDFQIERFEEGITACAGIAFIQETYPFHYAVDLAEKLCKRAKDFVKKEIEDDYKFVPKSALSFFKVQDSFIESKLEDICERVLNADSLSFDYGPYLLHSFNGYANIGELSQKLKIIEEFGDGEDKANGVSKLRQWAAEVFKDKSTADFMKERMRVVNNDFMEKIEKGTPIENDGKSIIYDVIQLHSFKK